MSPRPSITTSPPKISWYRVNAWRQSPSNARYGRKAIASSPWWGSRWSDAAEGANSSLYGPGVRRATWTDAGLDIVDADPPPLPDGWVRLKVEACGICGSELHFW